MTSALAEVLLVALMAFLFVGGFLLGRARANQELEKTAKQLREVIRLMGEENTRETERLEGALTKAGLDLELYQAQERNSRIYTKRGYNEKLDAQVEDLEGKIMALAAKFKIKFEIMAEPDGMKIYRAADLGPTRGS